ncbi:MAG TPA: hypothetical protein VHD55_02120 [Candidatus Paceibacterota bacterium]|nr:hypothetical protein [Candidatus Paceibacterota bacterium]
MKTVLIAIAVVVVGGAAWWFLAKETASAPTVARAPEVSWQYADKGGDETGTPQTEVSVTISGKTSLVGTYQGRCASVSTLADGEVSGTLCWWAGGGKELGVFNENGKWVVKEGDQDEGSGDEPGFRGNFKTLFEIK